MFQIFVDSAANLPAVIAKQYNIHVISFINLVSGKEVTCYNPDLSPEEERQKGTEYYNAMREGCEIKTGLISTAAFEEESIAFTVSSTRFRKTALIKEIKIKNIKI